MLRSLTLVPQFAHFSRPLVGGTVRYLSRERFFELHKLQENTNFEVTELNALVEKFRRFASPSDGHLGNEEFKKCMSLMGVNNDNVIDRYFAVFDTDQNGRIDFKEFIVGISVLLRGSPSQRIRFAFNAWDTNSDGTMDLEEFTHFMKAASMDPNKFEPNVAQQAFKQVDRDGNGKLDFDEFRRAMLRQVIAAPTALFGFVEPGRFVGLSPQELEVIGLLSEQVDLKNGERLPDLTGSVYMIERGAVQLLVGDTALAEELVEEEDQPSFLGAAQLLTDVGNVAQLYNVVGKASSTKLVRFRLDELSPLVLHGHPGAVSLAERMGSNMFDQLKELHDLINGDDYSDVVDPEVKKAFNITAQSLRTTWALRYHSMGTKGKIEIAPCKEVGGSAALSVAYSPGVAEPCIAINKDPDTAYEFTSKGHLVGVVSNGTAVLGLGNIGAAASKPVMEGKAVLFKKFGLLDAFDIELQVDDPEKLVEHVCALEPTFGGINLEDIKSPDCFYVEKECQRRMNIPVMHDDQHGTAIIAGAGMLNAVELANKNIEDLRVVVSGCGAAGFTCAKYFLALGVKRENLIAVDKDGVVSTGRPDIQDGSRLSYLQEIATTSSAASLNEAMEGADMFLGLSVGNLLKPEMVKRMARDPLIFALANPTPEISYELAKKARKDCIVGTGRSDHPNQINNVCAFPYIFRGALDCRAKEINETMKFAASAAIAKLARAGTNGVDEDKVAHASLTYARPFSKDHIIPKPFDPRLLWHVAPAVARAAQETGVARVELDTEQYEYDLREVQRRFGS